jgi:hypothetical protein
VREPAYSDAEIDAAIAAIADPERLQQAQDLVLRAAPSLARVLAAALSEGGWFGGGHEQAVREAATFEDAGERARSMHNLLAEETRLGMLVGVAVGFELARELSAPMSRQRDVAPDRTPSAPADPITQED